MKNSKKSQLTVFIITGILLILVIGITLFSISSGRIKKLKSENTQKDIRLESEQIKSYIEQCIEDASFNGLFNKIGPQGGYIDPEYNEEYAELTAVPFEKVQKLKIAIWNDGLNDISPSIDDVEKRASKYIYVEAQKCLAEIKKEKNYLDITYSSPSIKEFTSGEEGEIKNDESLVSVKTSFNADDVEIEVIYPVEIILGDSKNKLTSFRASLPFNYKTDFELAKMLIRDIIASQPVFYDLWNRCNTFVTNDLTNLYIVDYSLTPETKLRSVRIIDSEPYFKNIKQALKTNFFIKNINAYGYCTKEITDLAKLPRINSTDVH